MTTKTKRTTKCGKCQVPGHNARTCKNVSEESVVDAFNIGGFTMNERVEDGGFIYFPTCHPWTAENEDQGRAFWRVKEGSMKSTAPVTYDDLHINVSRGFANERQINQMYTLLERYVNYKRQQKAAQQPEDH